MGMGIRLNGITNVPNELQKHADYLHFYRRDEMGEQKHDREKENGVEDLALTAKVTKTKIWTMTHSPVKTACLITDATTDARARRLKKRQTRNRLTKKNDLLRVATQFVYELSNVRKGTEIDEHAGNVKLCRKKVVNINENEGKVDEFLKSNESAIGKVIISVMEALLSTLIISNEW
ncbi:hypothetical protein LOAG_03461 [Loa loa]|uniref:Uncharacterized protein n=1 Tax=Loa loa TaxID=7209 RepID=A0A1S0U4N0_LOALO|nr:hypothetical protein LOAG_03461 [Loa loa]EFO25029.1 hypothetical protein LOAG_03461 [Loa loa]